MTTKHPVRVSSAIRRNHKDKRFTHWGADLVPGGTNAGPVVLQAGPVLVAKRKMAQHCRSIAEALPRVCEASKQTEHLELVASSKSSFTAQVRQLPVMTEETRSFGLLCHDNPRKSISNSLARGWDFGARFLHAALHGNLRHLLLQRNTTISSQGRCMSQTSSPVLHHHSHNSTCPPEDRKQAGLDF